MLGPVNHNAVEEYDELSQRYEKMTEEKADLEKAIEDLSARSPPDRREIFVSFLPGGQATISIPALRGSSQSV